MAHGSGVRRSRIWQLWLVRVLSCINSQSRDVGLSARGKPREGHCFVTVHPMESVQPQETSPRLHKSTLKVECFLKGPASQPYHNGNQCQKDQILFKQSLNGLLYVALRWKSFIQIVLYTHVCAYMVCLGSPFCLTGPSVASVVVSQLLWLSKSMWPAE